MTAGGFPHSEILGSKPCWRLPEAYRSLKRPHRYCLPRHPPYALASNPHDPSGNGGKPQAHGKNSAGNTNHHTNDHTQNDQTPDSEESGEINSRRHPRKGRPLLASTIQFSNHHAPAREPTHPTRGRATGTGHGTPATPNGAGWRPGTQKHARTTPGRTARPARPKADSTLPHQQPPRTRHIRGRGHTPATRQWPEISVERR